MNEDDWMTTQLRVRRDAHAYLKAQAKAAGLSVTQVAGAVIAHAAEAAWQVQPPVVTEPGQPWQSAAYAAADAALDRLPQPGNRFERDRWGIAARTAVDAAERVIRADERRHRDG